MSALRVWIYRFVHASAIFRVSNHVSGFRLFMKSFFDVS
jgi:hypothetical protein